MSSIVREIGLGFSEFLKWGDPRVEYLPFMGSPLPLLVILISYFTFVFHIGPNLMKDRKPYDLTKIIIGYNVLQIVINCFGVYLGTSWLPHVSILCIPVEKPNLSLSHYLYLLVKIVDLFDTVFFVLRKKFNQISFLHLYHHSIMLVGTWLTCKYVPGGQLYVVGYINCFVHVVMYVYYLLTAWDASYKKSIWWKKHLTQLQIAQHFTVFVSFLLAIANPNCNYPKLVLGSYLPLTVLMIYLFGKFYYKEYVRKNHAAKE